jgi:hypothetical protein
MSTDEHTGYWVADNWIFRPAPSNRDYTESNNIKLMLRPERYFHTGTTERRNHTGASGPGINEIYLDLSAGFWARGAGADTDGD